MAQANHVAASLTLDHLAAIAGQNHPGLLRANAEVDAAYGRWKQVGLYPNPEILYRGRAIGNLGSAGMQGGVVRQEFVTGGKLHWNRQTAAHELQRIRRQRDVLWQRVLTDVRVQFYEVLVAQQLIELSEQLVRTAEQSVQVANTLQKARQASEVDVLQTEVAEQETRLALDQAINRHRAAWERLAAVVGQPYLPVAHLDGNLLDGLAAYSWDGVLQQLLTTSPELAVARAEAERTRAAYQRALREPIPNVTLQAGALYDHATNDAVASVEAALPLPLFNRNQGEIRNTRSRVVAAEADISRQQLWLQQRLAPVFAEYETARQQEGRYRTEILPRTRRALDLVRLAYQQGQRNYLELLIAQQSFFETSVAHLEVQRKLRLAATRLEGLLLEGSLQASD